MPYCIRRHRSSMILHPNPSVRRQSAMEKGLRKGEKVPLPFCVENRFAVFSIMFLFSPFYPRSSPSMYENTPNGGRSRILHSTPPVWKQSAKDGAERKTARKPCRFSVAVFAPQGRWQIEGGGLLPLRFSKHGREEEQCAAQLAVEQGKVLRGQGIFSLAAFDGKGGEIQPLHAIIG